MPLGNTPTLAEVQDLVRAKDYEFGRLKAAHDAYLATWLAKDPDPASAWDDDYQALVSRYEAARAHAVAILAQATPGNVVPLSVLPDLTGEYDAIARALQPVPGTVTAGDFQDVWNRLTIAQNAPIAEDPRAVQPTATDWDLRVFQGADAATRKLEHAGEKTGEGALLVFGILGLLYLLKK